MFLELKLEGLISSCIDSDDGDSGLCGDRVEPEGLSLNLASLCASGSSAGWLARSELIPDALMRGPFLGVKSVGEEIDGLRSCETLATASDFL